MTWWARLEGLFVFEILILREKPSAKSVTVKERLPSGTGRRIKHWGKLMRLLYSDQPKSLKVIQDLMVESLELAGERNVLMHSFWPYTQENPDEVQLHNLKIDPTDTSQHQETVYVANVEELDDLNERIRRLYVRMVAVAFNASQKAPPFQSS